MSEEEPTGILKLADFRRKEMSKETTVTLKLTDIRLNTDGMTNSRSEIGDVTDLRDNILERGLLQPMCVWQPPGKDYYTLAVGFRRHAALSLIREIDPTFMDTVTCGVVLGGLADAQAANLSENIRRKDLGHADLAARLCDMYVNRRMKESEIAKAVGLSQPQVSNLVAVNMKCIPAVMQALKKGWINLATAKKLARQSADKQAEALEMLLNKEQTMDIDNWLANQDKGTKKPGVSIIRQKLKQIEAHSSKLDVDYRKGVCVGILYTMGLITNEQALMQPVEGTPTSEERKAKGRGKSLKTLQQERAEKTVPAE